MFDPARQASKISTMAKDDWEMLAKLVKRATNIASGEDRMTSEAGMNWSSSFEDRVLAAIRAGDVETMRALLIEPHPAF